MAFDTLDATVLITGPSFLFDACRLLRWQTEARRFAPQNNNAIFTA